MQGKLHACAENMNTCAFYLLDIFLTCICSFLVYKSHVLKLLFRIYVSMECE